LSRCVSRQEVLKLIPSALGVSAAVASFPPSAFASGGATAGRTTSIPTAKKRYFGRITADVKQFNAMGDAIKAGDLSGAAVTDFWATAGDDFKTAGYLLAVAFKIDGRIPPDKIQQKRDHDALMIALGKLQKATSKRDAPGSQSAFADVREKLDVYLKGVELPESSDKMYQ